MRGTSAESGIIVYHNVYVYTFVSPFDRKNVQQTTHKLKTHQNPSDREGVVKELFDEEFRVVLT